MKLSLKHVGPAGIAGCLWLVGNMLWPIQAVKGQEISQVGGACNTNNDEVPASCALTGVCSVNLVFRKLCGTWDPLDPNSKPEFYCDDSKVIVTTGQNYFGPCPCSSFQPNNQQNAWKPRGPLIQGLKDRSCQ